MDKSRCLQRDLSSAEKLSGTSIMTYERRNLLASTTRAMKAAKLPCAVSSCEDTLVKHFQLRPLVQSESSDTCVDDSGRHLRNFARLNGACVRYYLRRTHRQSSSKNKALQASAKGNEAEMLNEPRKLLGQSALEPINLDIPNEKLPNLNDQQEFIESVKNSTVEEPLLSTESSSWKSFSLPTRSLVIHKSVSNCSKNALPCEDGDDAGIAWLGSKAAPRNGKRHTMEEEDCEIECTGESEESNVSHLDKVNGDYSDSEDVSRKKVKLALHMFQTIYNTLSHEVELKSMTGSSRRRLDLIAMKHFKEKSLELKFDLISIGHVPGVEVGDEFHSRVELCMLGLHRQLQGGIDFVKQDGRLLARSIISSSSSRYSNNANNSQVLIYSGSGALDKDQKLEYGNLALKNSIDAQNPIRVFRGFEDNQIGNSQCSKGKKTTRYIYDGLYLSEKIWMKKNDKGCNVIMFQLRRKQEQPELVIKQAKLRTSISFSDICIEDISYGKEEMPICVVNTIDEDSPVLFTYTKEMIYPSKYSSTLSEGCDCLVGCSDFINCACVVKNGGELPFNGRGAIVQAKPLVYECGPSCKCPPTCHNRVSQHGIKFPLEIYKTKSMGWGVRSLSRIPSGSFVCEYVGELLKDEDAQKRSNDEYLFAIGNNYYDDALWEGIPNTIPELQKCTCSEVVDDVSYTIDASIFGNVARFINHSCTPNLYAQNLLYDHANKSMPHIMLFSSEDIPPLQELTYHYNYTIDQVHDSSGNIKQKVCLCGSIECTGRLY